jgi:23S rRNA pseudouridine2457 synthase
MADNLRYFAFYKPYGYLSQFTSEGKWLGLTTLNIFPKDVYALGRLDADSEGLLLLTNDGSLNHILLNPKFKHTRTYWIQVEGDISEESVSLFRHPMELNYKGKTHRTFPSVASKLDLPDWVPDRDPPIRYRASIPTSWISLTITEGKNRQVRKMTAQVGHPTLRLIRHSIENVTLEGLKPGDHKEIQRSEMYSLLGLSHRI